MSKYDKRSAPPYTLLADGYDVVMTHVDYVMWADYILDVLRQHHPTADEILELGCGTGSLALVLQSAGRFSYTASDFSEEMLAVARRKARQERLPIAFEQIDFRDVPSHRQFDVILLLYDGINYVVDSLEVARVLASAHDALNPGGVFIFDQSTPANSLNHSDGFDDTGRDGDFRYLRTSRYDAETRLHTTLFRLDINGKTHTERHVQRAYSLEEMTWLIHASPFESEASYDGFSFDPATEQSERIHHVLRRPLRG